MVMKKNYEEMLDEATKWFILMRADEVSDERAEKFCAWVEQSDDHLTAYIDIGGFWDKLPLDQELTLEQKQDNIVPFKSPPIQKPSEVKTSWYSSRNFHSIAASIAALFVVGYFYSGSLSMDYYSTEIGEITDIVLADGSHLVMNTNSEISVDMQDDKRIVYLTRGEVFFEIAKDKSRPFYVETDGGLVKVLGTKFNIRDRGNHSDITVIEGLVSVTDHARFEETNSISLPEYKLTKDQKFILGDENSENKIQIVKSSQAVSWRMRQLIYNGQTFKELITDLNRYYKKQIKIGDLDLNNIKVIATVKIKDQETTLKALAKSYNITIEHVSGDVIYLYSQKK